jgi:hypothetical protein
MRRSTTARCGTRSLSTDSRRKLGRSNVEHEGPNALLGPLLIFVGTDVGSATGCREHETSPLRIDRPLLAPLFGSSVNTGLAGSLGAAATSSARARVPNGYIRVSGSPVIRGGGRCRGFRSAARRRGVRPGSPRPIRTWRVPSAAQVISHMPGCVWTRFTRRPGRNVPLRRSAELFQSPHEGELPLRRQASPVAPERREDVIRRHPTSRAAPRAPP